jgi:hypothetical protein
MKAVSGVCRGPWMLNSGTVLNWLNISEEGHEKVLCNWSVRKQTQRALKGHTHWVRQTLGTAGDRTVSQCDLVQPLDYAVQVSYGKWMWWREVIASEATCFSRCLLVLLGSVLEIVLFFKLVIDTVHGGEIWLPSWLISHCHLFWGGGRGAV